MSNPGGTPKNFWKPGQSGNPNGRRPKGYTLADKLNERDMTILGDGRTQEDHYLDQLYSIACGAGKPMEVLAAINTILERRYGKPLDRIEFISEDDELPPTIEELQELIRLRREQDEPEGNIP